MKQTTKGRKSTLIISLVLLKDFLWINSKSMKHVMMQCSFEKSAGKLVPMAF